MEFDKQTLTLKSALCSCLSPQLVYNKSLNRLIKVPCGHCSACRVRSASVRAAELQYVMQNSVMNFFGTLTYSNDRVPLSTLYTFEDKFVGTYFVKEVETRSYYDRNVKGLPSCRVPVYGEEVFSFDSKDFSLEDCAILRKGASSAIGGYVSRSPLYTFMYLRKRDAVLFKKRLYILLHKYFPNAIFFIYLIGEYGPKSLRPHYHFNLCANQVLDFRKVLSCVTLAWQQGDIDLQFVKGDTANYVAGYLNGVQNLPTFLLQPETRPFSLHTSITKYLEGCAFRLQQEKDSFLREEGVFECKLGTETCSSPLPKAVINSLFPRPTGFCEMSFYSFVKCYQDYSKEYIYVRRRFKDQKGLISSVDEYVPYSSLYKLCTTKVFPNTCSKLTLVDVAVYNNARFARKVDYLSQRFNLSVHCVLRHIYFFYHGDNELSKLSRFYSNFEYVSHDVGFDLFLQLNSYDDWYIIFANRVNLFDLDEFHRRQLQLQCIESYLYDSLGNPLYSLADLHRSSAFSVFHGDSINRLYKKTKTKGINDLYRNINNKF